MNAHDPLKIISYRERRMDGKTAHGLICNICSNQLVAPDATATELECERCGHKDRRLKPRSRRHALAYATTALVFYIPANVFPFMTIELYGRRNSSTIWSGVVSLAESGSWALSAIVFLASLAIPLVKLVAIFYLAATAGAPTHRRFKTSLYHGIEAIGRWSMLDIFLLAVLVAIMKLGPWTAVEPEVGALMFAFVVIFTMLASASFDPQLIWKDDEDR